MPNPASGLWDPSPGKEDGPRLGIETIDWRGVREALAAHSGGRALVLVNRPATDPGLYYLAAFDPVRVPPGALAPDLPARVAFVHLTGNAFSEQMRDRLAARGVLAKVAEGNGWELYFAGE